MISGRFSQLLVSTAIVAGSLLIARPANACDCAGRPTCATFWDADLAFVGRVKAVATPMPGKEETTFEIEEWLRGEAVKASVTIVSNGVGYSCDYDFTPSTRYLVIAYKAADGSWKAFLCGGTASLDSQYGKAALKEIRQALTSSARTSVGECVVR